MINQRLIGNILIIVFIIYIANDLIDSGQTFLGWALILFAFYIIARRKGYLL